MRGKLYYIAKKMITAAIAVNALPLIWNVVTSCMVKFRVNGRSIHNYVYIILIGKALIPVTMSMSFAVAVSGVLISGISMKKKDIGAGKLLTAHILIAAVSALVTAMTFKNVIYLYDAVTTA